MLVHVDNDGERMPLTLEKVHDLVGNEIFREVIRGVHTAHNVSTVDPCLPRDPSSCFKTLQCK